MNTEQCTINLQVFEGPLDLLMHLIKKDHLSITDIPISNILDQYISYIELMKELNIDLAGEFILMAAELAHIKSKMLVYKNNDQENEEEDPRADLTAKLLEYQKYKRASEWLESQPRLHRDVFKKTDIEKPKEINLKEDQVLELDPFSLITAFQKILKEIPEIVNHEVVAERVSVTERIYEIMSQVKLNETVLFIDLFKNMKSRSEIVVSFLAILEMTKLKMIQVFQMEPVGPIRIKKIMNDVDQEINV